MSPQEVAEFALEHFPNAPEKLAEKMGVSIRRSSLPCDGWCIQHEDRKVIRINAAAMPVRQRFTLAHEMGHIVLGLPSEIGEIFGESRKDQSEEERRVNEIAADLLLPAAIAKSIVTKIPVTARKIEKIAAKAGASQVFVARRLATLAESLGMHSATVLFFEDVTFSWQYPDPSDLQINGQTASKILAECIGTMPRPARFDVTGRDSVKAVASVLENPYLNARTILVQVVDRKLGEALLDEELEAELRDFVLGQDDNFAKRLNGCVGYMKNICPGVNEALTEFNKRYVQNASYFDEQDRERLMSEDGMNYIYLRLKRIFE